MSITEILEESILLLKVNKMRTALSALGIIIGIGSVITLMTLGQASQANVKARIEALGSNLLMIRPGSQNQGFLRTSSGSSTTLKYSDYEAIANSERITTLKSVSAEYTGRLQISYGRNNSNVSVSGVTGDYFEIRNIQIGSGSTIDKANNDNIDKVVVIGPSIAEDLFGEGVNPIGENIKIGSSTFTVIGVTKSKGGTGPTSLDEVVYVPLITAQRVLFGGTTLSTIYASAKDDLSTDGARNQLGFLLLELHRKASPDLADFTISSQSDLLETVSEVTDTFTALLTGIAAISLIVGGIGIMNIMLVTVTERTSEIGLRMALGAKSKTIVTQFLTESVVLTFIGGMIGVALGIGASFLITKIMSLPTTIAYESVALAVGVSCVIGIIFGWYPAYKASRLQPIEALRYE